MTADVIATWVDQLTKSDAYDLASSFRAAVRERLKADGVKGPEMPVDTIADILVDWFPAASEPWDGVPDMSPEVAAKAAPRVAEWIELYTKNNKPYGLMSVDDFVGIPHAIRCGLRGTSLDLPKAEKMDPSSLIGGKFNLRS
jgi:hypothetical protein